MSDKINACEVAPTRDGRLANWMTAMGKTLSIQAAYARSQNPKSQWPTAIGEFRAAR